MPLALLTATLALRAATTRTFLILNPAPGLFQPGKTNTVELKPIDTGVNWTEAVPSWNIEKPENAILTVEARLVYPDHATKYYSFGTWTYRLSLGQRASVTGQKDEDGNVLTDTLRTKNPGGALQFRLTGAMPAKGTPPKLTRLIVNVADTQAPETRDDLTSRHPAWGLIIDPPQRAQGWYPGGKALCSPTSVSMVLAYWAGRVGRKSLDKEVPEVQSGVFDSVYGGTGNWAFNASYAGSQTGLIGFAARLSGMDELESWITAGVPVVCSVSWYLLHGEPLKDDEEGHLVVLDGFMPNGDPVFNDPGDREQVRKMYKRADFEAAWNYSKRSVYVIGPSKLVQDTGALTALQSSQG